MAAAESQIALQAGGIIVPICNLAVGENEVVSCEGCRVIIQDEEKALPLRSLITRLVLISVANYGKLAFLDMTTATLLNLIWSTSVEFGGLGMSPVSIGLWMAGYSTLNGIIQYVAFPRIVGRLVRGRS
jgi:hypothetical protein